MSNTTLRVGCCYACGSAVVNPIQYVDGLAFHSWCVPSAPTMSSLEAQRDTAQHWLKAEQEITKQLRERIAALEAELKDWKGSCGCASAGYESPGHHPDCSVYASPARLKSAEECIATLGAVLGRGVSLVASIAAPHSWPLWNSMVNWLAEARAALAGRK